MKILSKVTLVSFIVLVFLHQSHGQAANNPKVKIETSLGDIVLELDQQKAPITVSNFLRYVNGAFYDGTIFHRVVKDFVIQAGGYTADGKEKRTGAPIRNESYNGLKNIPGSVAMARTADPHSAQTQFYINTSFNVSLDGKPNKFGYAVFGKVISGMDVVRAIENVAVSPDLYLGQHRPQDDVLIKRMRVQKPINKMLKSMIKSK